MRNFSVGLSANLFILITFHIAGYAQKTAVQNLNDIINGENSFAKMAADISIKKAFLANLDTTGLVFSGTRIVNGFQVYGKAKEDNIPLLTWYPAIAAVASSGDIGFTSGPYMYKAKRTDTTSFDGYYFTLWKRNREGDFKVILDGGVSHNAKFKPELKLESASGLKLKKIAKNKTGQDFRQSENSFATIAETDAGKAYQTFLNKNAWMLRNQMQAHSDKSADLNMLKQEQLKGYHFAETGYRLSRNKDMAYSYGEVNVMLNNEKKGAGFYIRIWQFNGTQWQIIADEVSYETKA